MSKQTKTETNPIKTLKSEVKKEVKAIEKKLSKKLESVSKEIKQLKKEKQKPIDELFKSFEGLKEEYIGSLKSHYDSALEQIDGMKTQLAETLSSIGQTADTKKPAVKSKTKAKTAAKSPKKAKPGSASKNPLTQLTGVGPAVAKKLNDAGISSLSQVANPSEKEAEALKAFESARGYSAWQEDAKKAGA